ncbi:MAG: 50S ribosomal protein L10 [Syntrophomonadaceae bacterium]|nr:50S ribosomal protein L10 [Bacillota bacterium]
MKKREDKQQVVSEVREDLQRAKVAIVTDYRGLNVAQISTLRRALRAEKVKYAVVKNTLARRAARDLGLEALDAYLDGPTAIAFSFDDPVAPAKVLAKYTKEFDKLQVKGGILQGRPIDQAGVKALADLPPREVLLGQVAGTFAAPMTGFAGALQAVLRKFVGTLQAVRDQKAGA